MGGVRDASTFITSTGASCTDPPARPEIDVVALSVGRHDGVYYAGRRYHRTTSEERRALRDLAGKRLYHNSFSHAEADRLEALYVRHETASTVVRWEIAGGLPSAPTRLVNRLTDGVRDPARFGWTWGPGEDSDANCLVHTLIHKAISDGSSDDYFFALWPVVEAFGDDWVLPQVEIRKVVAIADLRAAKAEMDRVITKARDAGISDTRIDAIVAPKKV